MRLEAAAVTIRGFLLADVLADLLQLEAHSGHGVPTVSHVLKTSKVELQLILGPNRDLD